MEPGERAQQARLEAAWGAVERLGVDTETLWTAAVVRVGLELSYARPVCLLGREPWWLVLVLIYFKIKLTGFLGVYQLR